MVQVGTVQGCWPCGPFPDINPKEKAQEVLQKVQSKGRTCYKTLEEINTTTGKALGGAKKVLSAAQYSAIKAPKSIKTTVNQGKALNSIAENVFEIPSFFTKLSKIVTAKGAAKKLKAAHKAAVAAGDLLNGIIGSFENLNKVKVIPASSVAWTAVVGKVLYPIQCLLTVAGAYKFVQFARFRADMVKNIAKIAPSEDAQQKIQKIDQACKFITENEKKLYKKLSYSEKCELGKLAQEIATKIHSESQEERDAGIAQGEKLVQLLRQRVNRKLGFEVANLALKITTLVGATLFTFTPFTLVGLGLALGGTVGSILTTRISDMVLSDTLNIE